MANIAKKVEVGANVAIIIVVVMIGAIFVRNYTGQLQTHGQISVGTKFALHDVNWKTNEKNLVFALSTSCHFCSESADFYRQIAQARAKNVRTIAVFPQSVAAAREYTKKMGIEFDEVRQASLSGLEISGTPTLLIIDNAGQVRSVWVGKLPPQTEKEVLARVGS
jgi:peroxiredoxin